MLLRIGSMGEEVKKVQRILKIGDDGIFGIVTETVVKEFQKDNKLDIDGVVGVKTLTLMKLHLLPESLNVVPTVKGTDDLIKLFGEPWIEGWRKSYLTQCEVPEKLRHVQGWQKGYFWCHRLAEPFFFKALIKIADKEDLCKYLKTFDGCYCVRKKRGNSNQWSVHSWAIAYDLNADENPMGHEGNMPEDIARIHEELGFVWGGRWQTKDKMHFQLVKGY